MKRSALHRLTEMKRANAKRRARLFEEAFDSVARVRWVQMQESVVSRGWPCVNAHVRSRGAGGKAGDIVPLTHEEHEQLHRIGLGAFEALHNVNLTELAAETDRRWRARTGGDAA